MKLTTYREIDSLDGVTVYELGELDYPFRKIVKQHGVDIQAVESFYSQFFDRNEVPYQPNQILPMLPSDFVYTTGSGERRVEKGIVLSKSIDALMRFSRENLVTVGNPNAVTVQFKDGASVGARDSHDFVDQLNPENNNGNSPYNGQPLVYLPSGHQQQRRNRHRQENVVQFYEEDQGEDSWIVFKYSTIDWYLRNPNRFETKTLEANGVDLRTLDTPDPEPLYVRKQRLVFDEQAEGPLPQTWNFVAGLSETTLNRQYIWTFKGRSGTARTAGELPVDLCEKFDEEGQQVLQPDDFSLEAPLRFLEPKVFIGGDLSSLKEYKSSQLDGVESLPEEIEENDILNKPSFVQDLRQPMNFHSIHRWKVKKKRNERIKEETAMQVLNRFGVTYKQVPQLLQYKNDELREMTLEEFLQRSGLTLRELKQASNKVSTSSPLEPPRVYDTELLAYILQRTQQSIFNPDDPPAGFDLMQPCFESDDVWYGLCEAQYHG